MHNVLGCRMDLYFHDYNLAIQIDENGHSDRSIDYEIKRQKAVEQELGCKFIRIHPILTEKTLIFSELSMKYLDIKQSTQKALIKKISAKLLGLECKSDNMKKSKTMKFIVKKILPDYK